MNLASLSARWALLVIALLLAACVDEARPVSLRGAPPPEEVIKFEYTAPGPRDLRIVAQAALLLYRDTGIERLTPARASAADAAAFEAKMQVAARCGPCNPSGYAPTRSAPRG